MTNLPSNPRNWFKQPHDLALRNNNQAIEPVHFLKAILMDNQGMSIAILK